MNSPLFNPTVSTQINFLADLLPDLYQMARIRDDNAFGKQVDHQHFMEIITLAGYKVIGHGVTRTVFIHELTPEVVYKFGSFKHNGMEYNTWINTPTDLQIYLADLYYTNGIVNVMKKLEHTLYDEIEDYDFYEQTYGWTEHKFQPYYPILEKFYSANYYLQDASLTNFGRNKDKSIQMIDYGMDHSVISIDNFPTWEETMKNTLGLRHYNHCERFRHLYHIRTIEAKNYPLQVEINPSVIQLIKEQKNSTILLNLRSLTTKGMEYLTK